MDLSLNLTIRKIYDKVFFMIANKHRTIYEKFYFKKLRKNLINKDFSLFSPNCYAGIIYHRLGLQFRSPTINLFFPVKKQYLKFVSNISYYLEKDLTFIKDSEYSCPVAMLDDVKIVFNHYHSEAEAISSWNKRKKRVNYDNIFIIFDDISDVSYNDLIEFNKISCKGKVIFTAKDYNNLNNSVQISKYKKSGLMKAYLLDKNAFTGKNVADRDFDFIKWLNTGKV